MPLRSRRRAIQHLAALGAVTAFPAALSGCSPARRDADVVVIGAGLSGLNAALILQEQGLDVLVVEGSKRIGGRVYTIENLPHRPDAGGSEFSITSYARVVDMVNRLGLEPIPWRGRGIEFAFHVGGETLTASEWPAAEVNRVRGPARNAPPIALPEMFLPRPSPLPTHDAWLLPEAAGFDVPWGDFMREAGADEEAIRLIGLRNSADDLNEVSALWRLHTSKFAEDSGGLESLRNIEGGMGRVTDGMASLLNRPVQLGTRVTGLSTDTETVTIGIGSGDSIRARFAICTASLTQLRGMAIEPALPELQAAAVSEIPYDQHAEVFFDIEQPFWEEDGLPSSTWTDGPLGLVLHLRESGPHGYLWFAVTGKASRSLQALDGQALMQAVEEQFLRIRPAARGRIRPMAAHSWTQDPWSMGHLAYRAPGQITRFGNVAAEPHGRIHFAGEHTAVTASGMEGAMESGERAALEIIDRIA